MNNRTQNYLALLLLSASLASAQSITRCGGPTTPFQVDWANFRFDVCHTGNNPHEHVLSPSTVQNLELKWRYQADSILDSSPAVVNGKVYIGSQNGPLYALDANTGTLLWMYMMDAYASSPAVANGVVYAASLTGLYALNADTGILLWHLQGTGSIGWSSPTVANKLVYVGSDTGIMYALNARTGEVVWSYSTAGTIVSSPAVVDDVVYVTSASFFGDNALYALNAQTGTLLWQFTTGLEDYSSPTVVNGLVYLASHDKNLYALNALTGELMWMYRTQEYIDSSPAVANGILYLPVLDSLDFPDSDETSRDFFHLMIALDANTGAVVWKRRIDSFAYASPAVANGVVYIACDDSNLHALDAATGAVLWTYTTGSFVNSSPAAVNGVVYVGSQDHSVYAFGLPN